MCYWHVGWLVSLVVNHLIIVLRVWFGFVSEFVCVLLIVFLLLVVGVCRLRFFTLVRFISLTMEFQLDKVLKELSIEEDKPLVLKNNPKFRVLVRGMFVVCWGDF